MPKQTQTPKTLAQQVARQILSEPFEILKNVGVQVSGEEGGTQDKDGQVFDPEAQTRRGQALSNNSQIQEKQIAEQKRKTSHIQAFQQELQEIEMWQRQREKEREEGRAQEEREKLQKQNEEAQNNSPLEIIGKVKRGILGGGQKANIHKKQRSTELVKTPSN